MSTHQLEFWEKTPQELMEIDMKECRNDITQLRKSMFARHGEFMKMLADLQKQINEMNK